MKKIYSLIALMLCFVGTIQAQHRWTFAGGAETNVTELVGGEDHYYVLRGGACNNHDGSPAHQDGVTNYMSSGDKSAEITHECVFQFIETGEMQGDFKVYVLKNVANGKYLSGGHAYEATSAKAFRFTVQLGQYMDEGEADKSTWAEYSHAVSDKRSVGAVEKGAWVLCSPNEKSYLCFYGNPAIAGYADTNNWLIIEVEEETMSEQDKLLANYNKYFSNFSSTEDFDSAFPVGNNPGCVSQEFLDEMKAIWTNADALVALGEAADAAQCAAASAAVIDLFENRIQAAVVPVSAGYYVLKNVGGRGFLTITDDGNKGRGNVALKNQGTVEGTTYEEWTPESMVSWNMNNAKYIWEVQESKEQPGKMLFKNFGTEKYLTHNNDYATAETADADGTLFSIGNFKGLEFLITFGGNGMVHVANHSDNKLLNYNDPNDAASRWIFYTIDPVVTDSLTAKVAQNSLNIALKTLRDEAYNDYNSLQYDNFVEGNSYSETDTGLVNKVVMANSWATSEGSKEALFDGDMKTYFHTAWGEGDVKDQSTVGSHWIKVDLGKEVTDLKIKFTKRQGVANGHINKYALYSLEESDLENPEMGGTEVAESVDSVVYQYANNTHIADYHFETPVRYLGFEVLSTRGRDIAAWDKMTAGTGPFWHMSEFRCYDVNDIVPNPGFNEVPEDVKANLVAAIEKADAELKEKAAQQTTIDELQAAYDAFWKAYPNPADLKEELEAATKIASLSVEAPGELGFFEEGAIEGLNTATEAIQAEIDAKEAEGVALSLKEIKALQAQLDEALAAFNAKLNKPVVGHVYQMVCVSGYKEDGSPKPQNDRMIASVNADVEDSPVHRYQAGDGEQNRFNTLWLVEEGPDGVGLAFKNLANGLYMNNVYEGLTEEEIEKLELPSNSVGYSVEPKSIHMESFANDELAGNGYFLMSFKKKSFVNFESTGNVVRWHDCFDPNSAVMFQDVADFGGYSEDYAIDVEPNAAQIITLPITVSAVTNVFGEAGIAYEVLGMKDGKVQLKALEGAIEAGTPFVVKTGEGEKQILVKLPNADLESNLNLAYNYDVVNVNGLVSAPRGFKTEEGQGYGVLINNIVVGSTGGDFIAGGTGYFGKSVGTTEVDGDYALNVEGFVPGDDTAIEDVEIVKNVPADVYTVSGVKVRQNVKAGVATQGLPKGVYVVGGKKVVVK